MAWATNRVAKLIKDYLNGDGNQEVLEEYSRGETG